MIGQGTFPPTLNALAVVIAILAIAIVLYAGYGLVERVVNQVLLKSIRDD